GPRRRSPYRAQPTVQVRDATPEDGDDAGGRGAARPAVRRRGGAGHARAPGVVLRAARTAHWLPRHHPGCACLQLRQEACLLAQPRHLPLPHPPRPRAARPGPRRRGEAPRAGDGRVRVRLRARVPGVRGACRPPGRQPRAGLAQTHQQLQPVAGEQETVLPAERVPGRHCGLAPPLSPARQARARLQVRRPRAPQEPQCDTSPQRRRPGPTSPTSGPNPRTPPVGPQPRTALAGPPASGADALEANGMEPNNQNDRGEEGRRSSKTRGPRLRCRPASTRSPPTLVGPKRERERERPEVSVVADTRLRPGPPPMYLCPY
ncbi:hypothetical protein FOCC_FOCC003424, partial [Frankliniella occidentalis]